MSYLTPGVPAAPLPLTGLETIAIDTNLANGANPSMAKLLLGNLAGLGYGTAPLVLTDGATIALDAKLGSYFSVTITGTGKTLTATGASPGQVIFLEVVQGDGNDTITTWTNVTWAAGTAPTLTVTAAAVDIVRLTWNSTAGKWRAETVGKAFA